MRSHRVFGVRVDDMSPDELAGVISEWLRAPEPRSIVTPNPEFLLAARRDAVFRDILNRSDLSLPDGVGLRFAIPALSDEKLEYRHTGVDTLELLARSCAAHGKRLALVGGAPGVARTAANALRARIPGLEAFDVDPGNIPPNASDSELQERSDRIKTDVRDASVVAVGLGQGKQERVMEFLRAFPPEGLPALRVLIGVGGAFDMIAKIKRRAPAWMRRIGLEWVWRLWIEPTRWRRIWNAFPVFPMVVIWDTLKHRRFLRACRATVPEIFRQVTGK